MSEYQQAAEAVKAAVEAANSVEKLGVLGMSFLMNLVFATAAITMYREFKKCRDELLEFVRDSNRN